MSENSTPPAAVPTSRLPSPAPVVTVSPGVGGGLPGAGDVAPVVSYVKKRKRAGTHLLPTAGASPAVPAAQPAAVPAAKPASKPKRAARPKSQAAGPNGAKATRTKTTSHRTALPPPVDGASASKAANPEVAAEVFDDGSGRKSFMDLLNETAVNIGDPPIAPYGAHGEVEDEDEDEDDDDDEREYVDDGGEDAEDEDVIEVDAANVKPKSRRTSNYTEIEDVTLCRAWAQVGMDATTGTDQTGKRYWQRIEDQFCKILPRVKQPVYRSFRSLQGRWDVIKPACSRWSAAMDQTTLNPPSGVTIDQYDSIADARYKDMAGTKGKSFPFKHCHDVLKHLPKWQLRDQETAPKKGSMVRMDDSEEEGPRNEDKPEGNKKAKERLRIEAEGSLLRDKFDQMMKSKEKMTMKTLEVKMLVTEKKREVKLAKVEATREESRLKAELEREKIEVKKAKAMKELLAEERELMMMSTKDMNEAQLAWWKEATAEITERRRVARAKASGGSSGTQEDGVSVQPPEDGVSVEPRENA